MASARTIRPAATAKVTRIPETTDAGDDSALVWLNISHHRRVIGGLEQSVAAGNHHERRDVTGYAEPCRKQGQQECADDHTNESGNAHPVCAQPVNKATGRNACECGNDGAGSGTLDNFRQIGLSTHGSADAPVKEAP